jgi:hypothetical protein
VVVDVVATVRVSVAAAAPVMVTEFDVKLHVAGLVAPVGPATAQVRLTAPVNPFEGVAEIVDVLPVVAPAVTLMLPPLVRAKLGTGAAETVTVTAFDVLPVKLVSPA